MKHRREDSRDGHFSVLGVRIDAVQIPAVTQRMKDWIARRDGCRFIAVTGMHGITEAQHDSTFKKILNTADLVVPDGMPLVWIGRARGRALRRRVYGPELMRTFCQDTSGRESGFRHFLYGGGEGIVEELAIQLQRTYSGIKIAGFYSPPYGALSEAEDAVVVEKINQARPDIVWVGLSTPKQEKWMHDHRGRLQVPVLVGVGAAFDLLSLRRKEAPDWMQEHGLEWMFRLLQEPSRLWRRYIVRGSEFLLLVSLELLGLRRFKVDSGR